MAVWVVRWRALEERFASASEALDRWERLDAFGLEPELVEVPAEGGDPVARGMDGGEDTTGKEEETP